jgi:uncharacterized membrane protein YgdD (TMEM256/DUF423 family)
MTVYVTRTTYSDFTPMDVHLCGACFGREAAKHARKHLFLVAGFLAFLTAVLALALSSPKAGGLLRAFGGAVFLGAWLFVVTFWTKETRRWRRGDMNASDLPFLAEYARELAKKDGRDALFVPDQWQELVAASERPVQPDTRHVVRILAEGQKGG